MIERRVAACWPRRILIAVALWLLPTIAAAQSMRGIVVDQTGLPLPGVQIELHHETTLLAATITGPDGTFELPAAGADDVVTAVLDGFEPGRVPATKAERIVLQIAH